MNEKNFEYLRDNIKYLGFGENHAEVLAAQLKKGDHSFQLEYFTEVNKKKFEAVLNFRKSDNSDMYFLNSFRASLERRNGEKVEQTFYLGKGKGVTAKEAYNLLEGRAVHKELSNKEGEAYKAWIQLDFKAKDKNNNFEIHQFHEKYGYDLKAAIVKYSISEMDGGEREKNLLYSLQKGNIQAVSIEIKGAMQRVFIEANPQYKSVNIYDSHMKRMQKEDLGQERSVKQTKGNDLNAEKKEEVSKTKKKEVKQTTTDDPGVVKKKRTPRKGLSV